jgi:hypothetical protein
MHEAGASLVNLSLSTSCPLYNGCMPAIEPKEKLDKVTILLPKDTVAKLDAMAAKALMGSRGRVIQSIVDNVWDSQVDLQIVLNALVQMQTKPPQKPEEATAWIFTLFFPLTNLLRRFSTYVALTPPTQPAKIVGSQPQPQVQSPPTPPTKNT